MDIDKLITFYKIAEAGSVTIAAKNLGMSKSTISRQLALLEEELQVPLFDRGAKKLRLTPQGNLLSERAKNILMEVEATKSLITNLTDEYSGTLRICTTHALASLWLSHFLHLFIEKYPKIHIEVIANSKELDLTMQEADVAIRPYSPNQEELIQNHLMRWRLHLYASKGYVEKYGLPKKVEELKNHRLVLLGDSPNLYPKSYTHWPLYMGSRYGSERKPFLVINSVRGMFNLVKNGVGIGNFSDQSPLFKQNEAEDLVRILPKKMYTDIDVYFIYPKKYKKIKPITALGQFLQEYVEFSETFPEEEPC